MRTKKNKVKNMPTARVIRKSSDASQDYFIPIEKARALYEAGKLAIDLTNGAYCELGQ